MFLTSVGILYHSAVLTVSLHNLFSTSSGRRSTHILRILLSPDAERPPSRLLAHTRGQYEISDLLEIYGAGTRNSACSSGGCSSGGGP